MFSLSPATRTRSGRPVVDSQPTHRLMCRLCLFNKCPPKEAVLLLEEYLLLYCRREKRVLLLPYSRPSFNYLLERALASNWAGRGTEVEMCWHCYPATVHFPPYGFTRSDMEDSYSCWWSDVDERMIVANKPTYWCQEDKPYWGIQYNIISFEERRYHDQYCGMQWTQRPHVFNGTLMEKTDHQNHSFEKNRFQHWLRDITLPSTLVAPARNAHAALQLTHTRMKDRESHAIARTRETPEQTELRRKKDRKRHAERRAQLRAQGLPSNIKTEKPYVDPNEIDRRHTLNHEAQQRWRDRLTAEKKQRLLEKRREEYYPTERRQKSNGPRHEKKRGR